MRLKTIIIVVILILIIGVLLYLLLRGKKESYKTPERGNEFLTRLIALTKQYGSTIVQKGGKLEHPLTRAQLDEILASFQASPSSSSPEYPYQGEETEDVERGPSSFPFPSSPYFPPSPSPYPPPRDLGSGGSGERYRGPTSTDRPNFGGITASGLSGALHTVSTATSLHNSQAGRGSIPSSSAGTKEERCRRILEKIFGLPFHKVRPKWLLSDKDVPLELDCYNEELKLALEYNGEQHYKFPNAFHKTEEAYLRYRQNDKRKRDICTEKGINLITVPFHIPPQNLYTHIVEELERLGYVDVVD